MKILSRFFAPMLSLALMLTTVSCEKYGVSKDGVSEPEDKAENLVTYPLISYLPHCASIFYVP